MIQKTKVPTLDFMPSGKLPSSSMSILGSAQMKETIQELKRRYEFIFFDSPPLLGVSDASILASEMDMVLQVIQYRRYPQPMTLRAKQMILKVGGNLMGIVLEQHQHEPGRELLLLQRLLRISVSTKRREPLSKSVMPRKRPKWKSNPSIDWLACHGFDYETVT